MPRLSYRRKPFPKPPPRRFWNETVRLPGLFEKNRLAGDHANALACWGRMAQHRHWELSRKPDYNPLQKSIVSIFQPKAGGTFLHNRLLQLGYHDFWWFYPDPRCHSICYASVEALELFLSGGCTCHSHARPHPNILNAFDRTGVDKVWIHLRNPAESVVSSYHHYLGEGHGEGEVGRERQRIALAEAALRGLTPGMEKSEFVAARIGWYVDWVAEWLRFANNHPGLIVFSYHKELANPQQLLGRVFGELGAKLTGSISAAPIAADRFRSKKTSGWRHELTPDVQDYIERRVHLDLESFPEFANLWT